MVTDFAFWSQSKVEKETLEESLDRHWNKIWTHHACGNFCHLLQLLDNYETSEKGAMFAYQELKKFINKVSPSDQSRLAFLLYFKFYFYEAETLFSSVKVSFRFRLLRVMLPWVNCAVLKGQAKNFSFFVPWAVCLFSLYSSPGAWIGRWSAHTMWLFTLLWVTSGFHRWMGTSWSTKSSSRMLLWNWT